MELNDILSVPNANPNLPPKEKEAREMFRYAALFFAIAAIIYFLWGLWDIFRGLIWSAVWLDGYGGLTIAYGVVRIVMGVIAFILKGKFIEDVLTPVDQRRTQGLEDKMIIYIILGFIFGLLISGILILLGYMKIKEVDTQATSCPTCGSQLRYVPQYDRWYCDNCGDYKVPVHTAEAQGPTAAPQPQQQEAKTCPTCGQQTRYIEQYDRWYCDNCQKYI